jgi:hypothetical protein
MPMCSDRHAAASTRPYTPSFLKMFKPSPYCRRLGWRYPKSVPGYECSVHLEGQWLGPNTMVPRPTLGAGRSEIAATSSRGSCLVK